MEFTIMQPLALLPTRDARLRSTPKPSFRLSERQALANNLLAGPQRHTLLCGGSRSGKIFVLVRAVALRALRGAGSRHAILRFRGNAARASIWLETLPKVMRLCFPGVAWKPHKQDGYIALPNESEIWVGGLDDHERVEKILGMEFVTMFYNECSQIPYGSVLMARTRLAQQIEGLTPREYFDCNPPGTGHYTYQLWQQGRLRGHPWRERPSKSCDLCRGDVIQDGYLIQQSRWTHRGVDGWKGLVVGVFEHRGLWIRAYTICCHTS
jgi:hypothetical protein